MRSNNSLPLSFCKVQDHLIHLSASVHLMIVHLIDILLSTTVVNDHGLPTTALNSNNPQ